MNPIDRQLARRRQRLRWRTPAALMAGGALALWLAAPAPAQLLLPPPGQQPQAIDFAADPLLVFLARETASGAFRLAIADAVARHPSQGEAAATTDAARAARRETRAALFPAFNASIIAARSLARDFEGNSAIVEGLVPRGRTDAAIGADQLLFDFGATGGRIAGGSARVSAAQAEAEGAATATTLAGVEAWYQVLGFQTLADLSAALVDRHRKILADTRGRVGAGLGTGGDVARAEAGLADAITDSARTARSLAAVRARYREVFGVEPPQRPPRPSRPASAAADAETARAMGAAAPQVVGARAIARALQAEARAQRGAALPQLSAGINATRFAAFEGGSNHDVRAQLVLRQALSAGGAESARIAEAKARARAADFAADRVAAEAGRDAEAAFADARILDASAPALVDAYRANRIARDTTAEQFRLSRGTLIDLLRAEEDFFAAARALLHGNLDRDLAHYTLLARTGELLGQFAISTKDDR